MKGASKMPFEEKNSESFSIGWICNTDIFLMASMAILVTASALSVDLRRSNDHLTANSQALDTEKQAHEATQTDLATARTERDAATRELDVATMNLKTANHRVSTLEKEKTEIQAQIAVLKESARKLNSEVTALSVALAKSEATNDDIKANIDTKEKELKALAARIVKLQRELSVVERQLKVASSGRESLVKMVTDLETRISSLQTSIKALSQRAEELQTEKDRLQTANNDLVEKLNQAEIGQGKIRQELLGIKGDRKRVLFLYDRSGSMKEREENTKQIVDTWLTWLNVGECAFIAFNDNVKYYPEQGKTMPMLGEVGKTNRTALKTWLTDNGPEGLTNTLGAFTAAYDNYTDIDMIVLFTDGAPRTVKTPKKADMDLEMRDDVLKRCKQEGIPVNTVGLGNYYGNKDLATFLIDLAKVTEGSFTGR